MRIEWNQPGQRFYETGVDQGVLYPRTGPGVPWNGLVSVNEETSGGGLESFYFDGVKYLDVVAGEDFKATLEAFSAPPEFAQCEGVKQLSPGLFVGQQPRKTFDLCYRTLIGNDLEGTDHGYKLHLVYNATASPSPRSHRTLAQQIDPGVRSWTIDTVPIPASTYKPAAHFVLDSTLIDPYILADIESFLYGRDDADARMLSQQEIVDILSNKIEEPMAATI